MLALILDSLGSTELLFILVIALIFFGPRKLPQLSRSLGKSMAEFRRASEEFKRTWEREVALESSKTEPVSVNAEGPYATSRIDADGTQSVQESLIERVPIERVVARESSSNQPSHSGEPATRNEPTTSETLRKQDWL